METTIAKTRTIGGSLVVTIPAEVVKLQNLKDGEYIEIKVRKKKRDYFGAFRGIGPYIREEDRAKDRE